MPKKARKRQKFNEPKRKSRSRRQSLVVIALILCMGLTSLILAQWGSIRSSFSPMPAPLPSPPPTPSKEYIYAGGRLVATEEPISAGSSLTAPTSFTAHADTTTQITLSWASTGAPNYSIERSTNYSTTNNGFAPYATVDCTTGCSNTVTFTDTVPLSPVTTYLYRVRSVSGSQQSASSTFDFATNKDFVEQIKNQDPGRTTISATHFLELRDAVNAVRAAAGLGPFTWSDPQGRAPASQVPILKSHMQDLRNGLDQALSNLGLTPQAYTDHDLPSGTPVRKDHINELRQRTKSVIQQP